MPHELTRLEAARAYERREAASIPAGDTLALDAFAGGAEFCPMGEFVIADARENGV